MAKSMIVEARKVLHHELATAHALKDYGHGSCFERNSLIPSLDRAPGSEVMADFSELRRGSLQTTMDRELAKLEQTLDSLREANERERSEFVKVDIFQI